MFSSPASGETKILFFGLVFRIGNYVLIGQANNELVLRQRELFWASILDTFFQMD